MVGTREEVGELLAFLVVERNAVFRANPEVAFLVELKGTGEVVGKSVLGGVLLEVEFFLVACGFEHTCADGGNPYVSIAVLQDVANFLGCQCAVFGRIEDVLRGVGNEFFGIEYGESASETDTDGSVLELANDVHFVADAWAIEHLSELEFTVGIGLSHVDATVHGTNP